MEEFIQEIVKEAGKMAMKHYGHAEVAYTKTSDIDFVTKADLEINRFLVEKIKSAYPDHGILSEEEDGYHSEAEYIWTVDPIDGTTNFVTNTPLFGVMVSLIKNGEIMLSAIILPTFDELYYAKKGSGSFMNDKLIKCSDAKDWKNSLGIMTANWNKTKSKLIQIFTDMSEGNSLWIGAYGCAAVSAAFMAGARRDWLITRGGHLWDLAPMVLLMREAGCKVSTFDGREWTIDEKELVVANPKLHAKLLAAIKKANL